MKFATARQSIVVPALMLSAWLVFRVTAHLDEAGKRRSELKPEAERQSSILAIPSPIGRLQRGQLPPASASISGKRNASPTPNMYSFAEGDFLKLSAATEKVTAWRTPRVPPSRQHVDQPTLFSLPIADLNRGADPELAPEAAPPVLLQATMNDVQAKPRAFEKPSWEGAGWIFLRSSGSPGLSSGSAPTLGGPQIGMRLSRTITQSNGLIISATARASAPLGQAGGKDASAGLSIGVSRLRGLRFFLERRLPLDNSTRSSWSALASFGAETNLGNGRLKAQLYAETGATRSTQTNPFTYARLHITQPISNQTRVGVELVADAQRDASRIDLGPVISITPEANPGLSFSAAWRLRAAGNAKPKSGPTFTVSTDF